MARLLGKRGSWREREAEKNRGHWRCAFHQEAHTESPLFICSMGRTTAAFPRGGQRNLPHTLQTLKFRQVIKKHFFTTECCSLL